MMDNGNDKCVTISVDTETKDMETTGGFLANSCRPGRRGMCITVVVLAMVIGSILLAFTAFASPTYSGHNLQQVAIVFRHGDRNPTETYPRDPYYTYNWPDGWGALTKKGMVQMYTLGQTLRAEYRSFIGDKYTSATTLVRSSYADRCIMSAQVLLAALFPPTQDDLFIPDLPWRPIPVYPIPRNMDKLITMKSPCPRLEKELAAAYDNMSANLNTSMTNMFKQLSIYTGQNISTITDVEFLYNTLEIEEANNLKLPDWTTNYYNNQMRELAARSLAIFTSNLMQRRLRGGPLLKEIIEKMRTLRDGTDQHKLYLYSAHDITLVNILRAMGFTNELLRPDYGAAMIFELYTINGGQHHEVQVSYLNNTETREKHPLSIPGCPQPCLLDNLTKTWQPVLPQNWDVECLT